MSVRIPIRNEDIESLHKWCESRQTTQALSNIERQAVFLAIDLRSDLGHEFADLMNNNEGSREKIAVPLELEGRFSLFCLFSWDLTQIFKDLTQDIDYDFARHLVLVIATDPEVKIVKINHSEIDESQLSIENSKDKLMDMGSEELLLSSEMESPPAAAFHKLKSCSSFKKMSSSLPFKSQSLSKSVSTPKVQQESEPLTLAPKTPAKSKSNEVEATKPSSHSKLSLKRNPFNFQRMRKAGARWFERMNPNRNFRLTVVVTGKELELRETAGTSVTMSDEDFNLDNDDPHMEIEPYFPGCLVSPRKAHIDASLPTVVTRFWITPLAIGDLEDACVRFRNKGRIVETLKTPTEVVDRSGAKTWFAISLLSPLLIGTLEGLGWTWKDEVRQGFPFFEWLCKAIPMEAGIIIIAIISFMISAFLFFITRPLETKEAPIFIDALGKS